jgi:hypothetical protein
MRTVLFYGRIIEWLDEHPDLRPVRFWTYVWRYVDRKGDAAYRRWLYYGGTR